MRKPAFCIFENKGADQLHGNGTADQCLKFVLHVATSIVQTHLIWLHSLICVGNLEDRFVHGMAYLKIGK